MWVREGESREGALGLGQRQRQGTGISGQSRKASLAGPLQSFSLSVGWLAGLSLCSTARRAYKRDGTCIIRIA